MAKTEPNPKQEVNAALERAKAGDFSGLPAIVGALTHDDDGVRIRAAYCCQRIGPPSAIEPLSRMAAGDPVSDNRNQAMFALAAIGRPAVVEPLMAGLEDEDAERRADARVALYQVLGIAALRVTADEEDEGARDEEEPRRVADWWHAQAARFDAARVYAYGEPASPGVFIAQLEAAQSSLPDALLDALRDWTGQEFGEAPLARVTAQWSTWWPANTRAFEAGRRYFYGHPVP